MQVRDELERRLIFANEIEIFQKHRMLDCLVKLKVDEFTRTTRFVVVVYKIKIK